MQVSMSKKWASQPAVDEATGEPLRTAKGKPVLRKSYSVLQDDFFQQMRSAGYTDLERGERGSSEEHLTVTQFKVKCEQERLAQLQEAAVLAQAEVDRRNREAAAAEKKAAQAKAKLNDVAPMLKGMEKLAEEFSSDPEQVLPEAGPLESARAYREKRPSPYGRRSSRCCGLSTGPTVTSNPNLSSCKRTMARRSAKTVPYQKGFTRSAPRGTV